jgi:hypothetical protein
MIRSIRSALAHPPLYEYTYLRIGSQSAHLVRGTMPRHPRVHAEGLPYHPMPGAAAEELVDLGKSDIANAGLQRLILKRRIADVAGAGPDDSVAPVLLDGVADPAHRPADGKEVDGAVGRQREGSRGYH